MTSRHAASLSWIEIVPLFRMETQHLSPGWRRSVPLSDGDTASLSRMEMPSSLLLGPGKSQLMDSHVFHGWWQRHQLDFR